MIQKPGITQLSYTGNALYAQGAFPQAGIGTADTFEVADQAQTRLLASRDPVINEVSVGMSGTDSVQEHVSGATPLALTDAINVPLDYCLVSIEAEQDLHGYQYPWPAGGGENLLDPDSVPDENKYVQSANGTLLMPSGIVEWRHSDFVKVEPNETYYFGCIMQTASSAGIAYYSTAAEGGFLSGINGTGIIANNYRLVIPSTAQYIRLSWPISEGYNTDWQNTVYFTKDSNAHQFTPYSNICPITGHSSASVYIEQSYDPTAMPKATTALGQTVYGGDLDMVSGIGSITIKGVADMADLSWTRSHSGNIYYFSATLPEAPVVQWNDQKRLKLTSSIFKVTDTLGSDLTSTLVDNDTMVLSANVPNPGVRIRADEYTGVTAFTNAVRGQQLMWEINITDSLITTGNPSIIPPAGDSVAWTDCGSTIDIVYNKQP